MAEHAGAEIDEFDASLGFVLEEDILGLEIGVNDGVVHEKD